MSMFFHCPWCGQGIEVIEKNCRIFRCGVFNEHSAKFSFKPYTQVPPHAKKEQCEWFVNEKIIFGCGKPFLLSGENKLTRCDYI